tara:strand:- start:6725 stop:7564 length:840 start_codon:yes stop_codon:yes gene_type:complete
MKNYTVVTTFNKKGMDLYGQKFINSFNKNVDESIPLIVYAENCNPTGDSRTTIYKSEVITDLMAFKNKWKDVPKANGICPFPEKRPRDHHKKFKWDAIRFSNKVYSVLHATEDNTRDWVIWMDADIVVHSIWPIQDFLKLFPDDKWLTYVGRGPGSQTWPECGFYGMNLKQPACLEFLKEFKRVYDDPENGIFLLSEWHDSFVFGKLLNDAKQRNANVLDYSKNIYNRTAKTGGGGHPFINCVLGTWLDHLKGDSRKQKGTSLKTDLMRQRSENYWKTI